MYVSVLVIKIIDVSQTSQNSFYIIPKTFIKRHLVNSFSLRWDNPLLSLDIGIPRLRLWNLDWIMLAFLVLQFTAGRISNLWHPKSSEPIPMKFSHFCLSCIFYWAYIFYGVPLSGEPWLNKSYLDALLLSFPFLKFFSECFLLCILF